ncbi:Cro/CI family transcriptional regulator [Pseudomonas aeruginosa]|uniref:Cro/CI family transcriptional regulator n=1 Tax=Pseudomonas aeruginosa TaxID=287 RepID=UPI0009AB8B83|nr:Cro/CI family transcriptional regulator [Pseudomonas aeruginosa]OPE08955.1 hypothetical protein APA51_33725 [Pseudomonas aeruginosa]
MNMSDAIRHFGSKKKLAEALRIRPSAVTQWGQTIPLARQYQLQVISKNKLKASPDLEPILPSDSRLGQCADTAVQASSAEVAQ